MSVAYWLGRKATPQKQRHRVFVVRAADPLWAGGELEVRDDLEYITANLIPRVDPGRVCLVNLSEDNDRMTLTAISNQLIAWGPKEWRSETLPATARTKFHEWIKELLREIADEPESTVIVIVSRSSFDIWLNHVKWEDPIDKESQILEIMSPSRLISVA